MGDVLYRRGIDTILRRCLTHNQAEEALNDCHAGACGGHLSRMATTQKVLREGYFWSSLFRNCITTVKICERCQRFACKVRAPPVPLHPVIVASPFCKWGVNFMNCNPASSSNHKYIIMVVDYFTKWAEAMPTYDNIVETTTQFLFNHVIARFGVPKELVSNHEKQFENEVFKEVSHHLRFTHKFDSPYYP